MKGFLYRKLNSGLQTIWGFLTNARVNVCMFFKPKSRVYKEVTQLSDFFVTTTISLHARQRTIEIRYSELILVVSFMFCLFQVNMQIMLSPNFPNDISFEHRLSTNFVTRVDALVSCHRKAVRQVGQVFLRFKMMENYNS
jgi:hypothetical protein